MEDETYEKQGQGERASRGESTHEGGTEDNVLGGRSRSASEVGKGEEWNLMHLSQGLRGA